MVFKKCFCIGWFFPSGQVAVNEESCEGFGEKGQKVY